MLNSGGKIFKERKANYVDNSSYSNLPVNSFLINFVVLALALHLIFSSRKLNFLCREVSFFFTTVRFLVSWAEIVLR